LESSDLSALATLDALLQESSVSRAARRLGLSTPAVSHALARLRERFDDPLLVRAGKSMVLTPRAEVLRPQVRDAIAVASRVFEASGEMEPSELERTFTLSTTDYVLSVFGRALDERVRREAPGVRLRFLPNALDDADRLRRGDSDLAVGIYGDLPPELKTRTLFTERLVCVVRKGHPTVKKRLTLREFVKLEHVQVAPRGRPGGYVDELLEARGLERRVARAVPFFHTALEMAATSDYVLTISERIAKATSAALGLVVHEPPLPLEPFALSMVWHPRFDGDQAHKWLRQQLVEVTADTPHAKARRRLSKTDPTTGRTSKRKR
jgi:DNA-binding transcriptional LysR family regulator